MKKEEIEELFFKEYSEDEKQVMKSEMRRITPTMYKLMEQVLLLEKQGFSESEELTLLHIELLNTIRQKIAGGDRVSPEFLFLLSTHNYPDKRKEFMDRISLLGEEKPEVLGSIGMIISNGKLSPEKIHVYGYKDDEEIILNAQLHSGEWIVATHPHGQSSHSPWGSWQTYSSKEKVDEEYIRGSDFYKAGRPLSHILQMEHKRMGLEFLNHDNTSLELSSFVNRDFQLNDKEYYDIKRNVEKRISKIIEDEKEI